MPRTTLQPLRDFGVRSLLIHAVMAVAFGAGLVAGIVIQGESGTIAMVTLIGFAAGMWLAHSVHSLGNALAGEDYGGIIRVVSRYVE